MNKKLGGGTGSNSSSDKAEKKNAPHFAVKKPGPANGFTPSYSAPPEPTALPVPNITNEIGLPARFDVTTLDDLCKRVLDSVAVLNPGAPLKVTTARAPSGLLCHALVLTPKNAERETSRWRVEIKGPGVPTKKGSEGTGQGRREALEALLDELERRVGREMLGV